jgi:hypothetical protein
MTAFETTPSWILIRSYRASVTRYGYALFSLRFRQSFKFLSNSAAYWLTWLLDILWPHNSSTILLTFRVDTPIKYISVIERTNALERKYPNANKEWAW